MSKIKKPSFYYLEDVNPEHIYKALTNSEKESNLELLSMHDTVQDYQRNVIEAYFLLSELDDIDKNILHSIQGIYYMFKNIEALHSSR